MKKKKKKKKKTAIKNKNCKLIQFIFKIKNKIYFDCDVFSMIVVNEKNFFQSKRSLSYNIHETIVPLKLIFQRWPIRFFVVL